jgi:glutathione S-transferase
LRESDYIVCGTSAITEFINARGLGYSLSPQNAMLAAMQNYWVDLAHKGVAIPVKQLIDELIIKKRSNANYIVNIGIIDQIYKQLSTYFSMLDEQIKNNKFIVCNKYTWADLYWTVYVHLCELLGCEELITDCRHINKWYQSIKVRRSSCGQDLVSYEYLPTLEQMLLGELKAVTVSDY